MTGLKGKKIAIVGCGSGGYAMSTMLAIRKAETLGMEVIHLSHEDVKYSGYTADIIIEDEMPRGIVLNDRNNSMPIEDIKRDYMPFIAPETRKERRAKSTRKKRRKF
jgi:hypothetical protein